MKILILGAGGFIGSHLIEALLKGGSHSVTGMDLTSYKIETHLNNPDFTFYEGDVYNDPQPLIAETDVVILLATICNPAFYVKNPVETIQSNFMNPAKIVDLCTAHKKCLINFSSCEIYGKTISSFVGAYDNEYLYEQAEATTPMVYGPIQAQRWSYACAKQLLERYIYAQHVTNGLPFVTIRPYNWIGPRLDYINEIDGFGIPRVMASFVGALMKNEPIKLVDGGEVYRVFTFITDAIDALLRVIDRKDHVNGKMFNIANPGNEISVVDLAESVKLAYARVTEDPKYLKHPVETISGEEFYGKGYEDCDRRVPLINEAMKFLGWTPKVNLEDTIYLTVKSFVEKYY